jgi:hypothetical protein
MLRHLYRCALRLHPSSFRRRFGDEMMYIFDQQKGTRAALDVIQDCVFSLLRQWLLRPHVAVGSLRSPDSDHIPSFETLEPFQPCAAAIIHGMVLSLILFYWQFNSMSAFSVRHSWIQVSNLHIPKIPAPVDVLPTEADNPQSKTIASRSPRTSAAAVLPRGVGPYVGKYISKYPSAKISIQIERDPLSGDRLLLSLAAAGQPNLALSSVGPARFVIVGAKNSYADFTADAQGRICCLSLVLNGKVITAQRQ